MSIEEKIIVANLGLFSVCGFLVGGKIYDYLYKKYQIKVAEAELYKMAAETYKKELEKLQKETQKKTESK